MSRYKQRIHLPCCSVSETYFGPSHIHLIPPPAVAWNHSAELSPTTFPKFTRTTWHDAFVSNPVTHRAYHMNLPSAACRVDDLYATVAVLSRGVWLFRLLFLASSLIFIRGSAAYKSRQFVQPVVNIIAIRNMPKKDMAMVHYGDRTEYSKKLSQAKLIRCSVLLPQANRLQNYPTGSVTGSA
jgi:hypothetical protein